jgi:hypothetical protein
MTEQGPKPGRGSFTLGVVFGAATASRTGGGR